MPLPKFILTNKNYLSWVLFCVSVLFLPLPSKILALAIFLYLKNKLAFKLVVAINLGLVLFQFTTTRIQTNFEFSGFENFQHQQLIDTYPAKLFRLANIVENKLESPITYRFRRNFFDCFDIVDYFNHNFYIWLAIPFFIGLVRFVQKTNYKILILACFNILILTLLGTHGKYGPVLILPITAIIISHYSCET